MPSLHRLTALGLARAMLAGPADAAGLAARMRACLGAEHAWQAALAARCARIARERWQRLDVRTLATLIERDAGYRQAWTAFDKPDARPSVRRYLLGAPAMQHTPPLGLHDCLLPAWPDTAALARWLGVSDAGMWRLTRPAAWQRRSPLAAQHYRCQLLAKRSGSWRLLEVPEPHLMALQRRLLGGLLQQLPPHQAACGYTRGRSVLDHARAHAGQAVVLKFDLRDFFTSVRAARVHALFATLGYSQAVARELTSLCTTATPEPVLRRLHEDGALIWQQLQRLRDPHLPQGAPSSAALANLCAFRLDLRLHGLARTLGAVYTRYADDIVLSGGAALRSSSERIARWVGSIALEEGFALNHRKTRCLRAGRRQAVCSIVVNRSPNLPRPEFDRLKAILHRCATQGAAVQNRDGIADWQAHLRGRVAWAAQLNPAKAQRLRRLFDGIDWSS